MPELIFLKLGGSLITDKTVAFTVRKKKIAGLAGEIAQFLGANPGIRLLLGHGSGSFGHTAARQYGTRQGVKTLEQWQGFAEVWYQASALNRHVMDALKAAGLPALAFAPVASVTARDGKVVRWDLEPLRNALSASLLPVVYGDVIFDEIRGGTILSTEDLFTHLAVELSPRRILLAGQESAVWADFPERKRRVDRITPNSFASIQQGVGAGRGVDVTGGMESKVREMLDLVVQLPDLSVQIFSGDEEGNLTRVLQGETLGTVISTR